MTTPDAPLTEDDCAFFIRRDGELEEISPDEHPKFEFVATVHGIPQTADEADLHDDDYLISHVGRIGEHYYELDHDTRRWVYLGRFTSAAEGAEAAAGADFIVKFESF